VGKPSGPRGSAEYPGSVRSATTAAVIVAAAALVGLLAYGLASGSADTTIESALASGDRPTAPTDPLPVLGEPGTGALDDHRGKVVVLNFWASWCKPCREEMPLLQETHERLERSGEGLVLGIDSRDNTEDAQAFLREFGATFPNLHDRDGEYSRRFGGTGYPETFVVDAEGNIAAARRFPVTEEWLREALREAS
jgi:cytochrome c biogenesis protein CcmG, thiol:disulfide interchange protein DsbE